MVGVVCSDGIILGTEKIVINKMMVSGTDKRTYSITRDIGCVSTNKHRLGFVLCRFADSRILCFRWSTASSPMDVL